MSTKPIPVGYHTVTPYLAIKNAVQRWSSTRKPSARWKCSD
jgi:hypothetical protein